MRFNHFVSACIVLGFFSLLVSPARAQLYCPNGYCDYGETQCDCPADCGEPPANEILGSTCNDGIDNDCDGLADGKDSDCVLPVCGDNVVNQASEECDGTDDAACPGQCQADCTCPPPPTGCCWTCDGGTLDCTGPIVRDDCPPLNLWIEDESCGTNVCGAGKCEEPTGSCCNDATGVCTEDSTQSDCEGSGSRYGGDGSTCATIDPPCTPPGGGGGIPTVSQWGIATLALLLLVGARVYFTRRRTISA